MDLDYDFQQDAYRALDLNTRADEIETRGWDVVQWQQEPDEIIWAMNKEPIRTINVRPDIITNFRELGTAQMFGLTFSRPNQVSAWHKQEYQFDIFYESCLLYTSDAADE